MIHSIGGLPRWLPGYRIHLQCRRHRQRRVHSPGQENPLKEGVATHSSILAWKISWTGEPGGLQSTGSQESDMTEHSTAQLKKQKQCCARWISDFSQIRTGYFSIRCVCAPPSTPPISCHLCAPNTQEIKRLALFFFFSFEG